MQISANTSVKTIEGAQPTTNAISFFLTTTDPPLRLYTHSTRFVVLFSGHYTYANAILSNPLPMHLWISVEAVILFNTPPFSLAPCVVVTRSCHTKSVVTKEQNVLVMRDIMCSGYVAGCNTLFFGETDGSYSPDSIQAAINKRLSFADDASGEYESMLAFPSTPALAAARDQVLSITSRLLPWEVTRADDQQYSYFPGGKAVKAVYAERYGLDTIHFGEDIRAAEAQEFIAQARFRPTPPPMSFNPGCN